MTDLLEAAGEALYGPRWQSEPARDLNVSDRTMRRWVAGEAMPEGIRADLHALCERRRKHPVDLIRRLAK